MADVKTLTLRVKSDGAKTAAADLDRVTASAKTADAAAGKLSNSYEKLATAMVNVGQKLTMFVTLPILGAGAASLKLAADFEVAERKFTKAFEGSLDVANGYVEDLNKNYGIAVSQGKKMLAFTGDLLKGFGATADQAAETAYSVNVLAASLSAYNGVPVEEASQTITKALLGERDALKSLGVVISEEAVQARLLLKGQQDLEGQALLLAKSQATLELAYEQSADAVASFSENTNTLSFQTSAQIADLKDIGVSFGQILIPVAKDAVAVLRDFTEWLKKLTPEQQKLVIGLGLMAAAMGPLLTGFGQFLALLVKVATAGPGVVAVVEKMVVGMTQFGEAATSGFGAVGAGATAALGAIALVAAGVVGLVAALKAIGEYSLTKETAEGFEAAGISADRYALTVGRSADEIERLREKSERYFSLRSTESASFLDFENQAIEFSKQNELSMQETVSLLKTSTALNKEQVGYLNELAKKYGEVELASLNIESSQAMVSYYQANGLKDQKKALELYQQSLERLNQKKNNGTGGELTSSEIYAQANKDLLAQFAAIDKLAAGYKLLGIEYDANGEKVKAFESTMNSLSGNVKISENQVKKFADTYKYLYDYLKEPPPQTMQLGFGVAVDEGLFDKLINKIKSVGQASYDAADAISEIGFALYNAVPQIAIDGLKQIGAAMADGELSADDMRSALADMAQQILNMLPMLFLQAGLQAIAAGNYGLGIGLIAAAGVSALAAGYVEGAQAEANNTSNSVATTTADTSRSVYSGGASSSVAPVNVAIENYSGQKIETTSERGPDGAQIVKMTVGSAYRSMTTDGEFNDVNRAVYGLTPVGVRQ